jgi:hypothetical protein
LTEPTVTLPLGRQNSNECKMTNAEKYETQVQSSKVQGSRLTDENSTVVTLGFWI